MFQLSMSKFEVVQTSYVVWDLAPQRHIDTLKTTTVEDNSVCHTMGYATTRTVVLFKTLYFFTTSHVSDRSCLIESKLKLLFDSWWRRGPESGCQQYCPIIDASN